MTSYFCNGKVLPVLALAIIGLISVETNAKPPSRIAGGLTARPGEFKYMVALMSGDDHICGGAIISESHILTAGHCVDGENNLIVYSGISDLTDPSRRVLKVSDVVIHPQYVAPPNTPTVKHDVALIRLAEKLTLGGKLAKVIIPPYPALPGDTGVVSGWGYVTLDYKESNDLMKLQVTLLDKKECIAKRAIYSAGRLCAYNAFASICPGDSGSPLVSGGYILGVASAGHCEIGRAHIYADVFYYRDWILKEMQRKPTAVKQ